MQVKKRRASYIKKSDSLYVGAFSLSKENYEVQRNTMSTYTVTRWRGRQSRAKSAAELSKMSRTIPRIGSYVANPGGVATFELFGAQI